MLPPIYFDGDIFACGTAEDGERVLYRLLEALAENNIAYLRGNPWVPPLYDAPVRYVRDPVGLEWWKGIRRILQTGEADCKSLAAWRVAELRFRGESGPDNFARFNLTPHQIGMDIIYHVEVVRGDDSIEDPSSILGMNGPAS